MNEFAANLWPALAASFEAFWPRLVQALFVLVIGLAAGAVVRRGARATLLQLERFALRRHPERARPYALLADLVPNALLWIFLGVAVVTAGWSLDWPPLTTWLNELTAILPRLITGLIILVAGLLLAGALRDFLQKTMAGASLPHAALAGRLAEMLVLASAVVVAASQLGLDLTFFTTLTSILLASLLFAAGLAFGLGAQGMVSNILAAHFLARSLQVGQRVRLGPHTGRVVALTGTGVELETAEGRVLVPARLFAAEATVILRSET